MSTLSRDERIALVHTHTDNITLNGERARILGYEHRFASVIQIKSGLSCVFAWETVKHIVNNRGGKFES